MSFQGNSFPAWKLYGTNSRPGKLKKPVLMRLAAASFHKYGQEISARENGNFLPSFQEVS